MCTRHECSVWYIRKLLGMGAGLCEVRIAVRGSGVEVSVGRADGRVGSGLSRTSENVSSSSTTSLTTGEPLEKSFSESLISSKSRSIGPDFVTFGPE